jgi:UDP-glucose 4-epimerase
MIGDECRAHGLGAVSLRYFNVAGASGDVWGGSPPGDPHHPARIAGGERPCVSTWSIFGTDYATPTEPRSATTSTSRTSAERTCSPSTPRSPVATSLQSGQRDGFSVREVIEAARAVTGVDIR